MEFKVGNEVLLIAGTSFENGKEVTAELAKIKVYVRNVKGNICTVARAKTGAVLGDIASENLKPYSESNIDAYIVQVIDENVPVYHSANKNSGILKRLNRFALFTIIDEKNNFGKLKSEAGWINLEKVKKLV